MRRWFQQTWARFNELPTDAQILYGSLWIVFVICGIMGFTTHDR